MKIRGTLTIGLMGIFLLSTELVQRTVIVLLVLIFPSRRERILTAWIQWIARTILRTVSFVGGAEFGELVKFPGKPGVLVIGNHQSLLDLPIACNAATPLSPRFITRIRYATGKPLISHLIRLYQYPTVDPRATGKNDLKALGERAAASPVPMMIYPEGTRTKDGSIGKFRRNGLRAMLRSRDWEVWVLTLDGFWQCAKLKDFIDSVQTVKGSYRVDGPLMIDGPSATDEEIEAFIDNLQATLENGLNHLREAAAK